MATRESEKVTSSMDALAIGPINLVKNAASQGLPNPNSNNNIGNRFSSLGGAFKGGSFTSMKM